MRGARFCIPHIRPACTDIDMEEYNRKTLIEALSTLREYDPPEELWSRIESAREQYDEGGLPRSLVRQLNQYDPPEQLWNGIAEQLDKGAKVRYLGWKSAVAVAASVALVLLLNWQREHRHSLSADSISITYSEEEIDPLLNLRDWEEDESVFQEYRSLCEMKKFICERPEFQQIQSELDELSQARNNLRDMINGYNTDPQLILQIKEIELERTDLLKKIMAMLI